SLPSMPASRSPTTARPPASIGIATVVNGGAHTAAYRRLSKPTTLISWGTATPRSARRDSTPRAIRSLYVMMAVTPPASARSAAWTPPSNFGSHGPNSTTGIAARVAAARRRVGLVAQLLGRRQHPLPGGPADQVRGAERAGHRRRRHLRPSCDVMDGNRHCTHFLVARPYGPGERELRCKRLCTSQYPL